MFDVGIGGGIAASMKAVRSMGADGHFAVNETGGQALLEAFREMATWVDDNLGRLGTLGEQPPLGSSHGASTIKPYVAEVATDQQGFITMLREFRQSLADAEQGVISAMDNYKQMDQGIAKKYS